MLKTKTFLILLGGIFLISACSALPASTPTATATATEILATHTPTITPLPSITPTPTASPVPTTAITPSDPATCQVVSVVPTANPTAQVLMPPATADDWSYGSDQASITIIEYGDFQSSASAQIYTLLMQLQKKYPDEVRLVFRHFPLSEQYDKDLLAAQAANAAGAQGKFWQFANQLYSKQSDWSSLSTDDFTNWAYERAAELGLDAAQFKTDMLSQTMVDDVQQTRNNAYTLMAAGTLTTDPYLFFNELPVAPPYSLDSLTNDVEYFKLPGKAYSECPPMTIDPSKQYTATLHTEKGDIVIELYADKAPWAVNSFVFLAEQGWYNNSGFYRVIPGFIAQAGDPSNSGMGNPGYAFTNELTPDLRFDEAGMVGMANDGNNGNGSQFFITYDAVPSLDGKYTVFGQVTSGMEVLKTLRPRNPATDAVPITPDPILSIDIEVK
ncbi:MAG: thioredoxin domain-containing protein [Anaerolineaceae bacterium]|nr:thioredoxin domain-containing protein [Anaerolineaceae bacterium]